MLFLHIVVLGMLYVGGLMLAVHEGYHIKAAGCCCLCWLVAHQPRFTTTHCHQHV